MPSAATSDPIRRIAVDGIPNDVTVFRGNLWVADGQHPRVIEIDPTSGSVVRTVRVLGGVERVASGMGGVWAAGFHGTFRVDGPEPHGVRTEATYSPVVAVGGGGLFSQDGDGSVSRIDPESGEILWTTRAARDVGDLKSRVSRDLAASRHGVWLADGTTGEVVRISMDGRRVERISIGPAFEEVEPDVVREGAYVETVAVGGGSVWVCCNLRYQVVRLDPETGSITGTVDVAVGGGDVAMVFGAGSLWMSESLGSIYRVDPRSLEVTGPVDLDRSPDALTVGEGSLWSVEGESRGDISEVPLAEFESLIGAGGDDERTPSAAWPVAYLAAGVLILVVLWKSFRRPRPRPV
jgi:outer membrane protein assembly factor BamB